MAADDAGGDALARTVTPEGLLVTVASPPYPTRAGDALAVGLVLWVVGAGLLGWVCVDGVGDGVGGADELAAPGELVVVAGFVVLGVVLGAAEVFEAEASGADLAEVAGLEALAGVVEREGVGDAVVAEVGGFGVLDAVGAGLAARAAVVTLPEMTKRPVASPRVTGRECADRIRAPCPCRLSRRDSAPGVNVPHVAQGCL